MPEWLQSICPAISAGIISADLMHLDDELGALAGGGVRLAHFDVMDNHFAPALTVGPPFIKKVTTDLYKDVHLMIEDPLSSLGEYAAAGADAITVHLESTRHIHEALRVIGQLKNVNDPARGIARGVALNPATPLCLLEPVIDMVDMVFVLAVNPGFGGQSFAPSTPSRVTQVKDLCSRAGVSPLIGIDGGITMETITEAAALRPDIVVSGSALFRDTTENARSMSTIIRQSGNTSS